MKKTIFSVLVLFPQLVCFSYDGELSSPMLDQQQGSSSGEQGGSRQGVVNENEIVEELKNCLKHIKDNDSSEAVRKLSSVLSKIEGCSDEDNGLSEVVEEISSVLSNIEELSDEEIQSLIEKLEEKLRERLSQQTNAESGHSVVDMSNIADRAWWRQNNHCCINSLLYALSTACLGAGGGLIYLGKILNEGGSSCKRIDSNGRITNDFW